MVALLAHFALATNSYLSRSSNGTSTRVFEVTVAGTHYTHVKAPQIGTARTWVTLPNGSTCGWATQSNGYCASNSNCNLQQGVEYTHTLFVLNYQSGTAEALVTDDPAKQLKCHSGTPDSMDP